MLWLGQCARARTLLLIRKLLIRKAVTCLLAKSTRKPPEAAATIMSDDGCLGATGPQHRLLCARQPQGVDDGGRKQQAGRCRSFELTTLSMMF